MDPIAKKVKQWIDEKKDPRTAHWQGGLEGVLKVFSPYMEPGKLVPAQPLEKDELPVFEAALEVVDLSPDLTAAFLPPSIAGPIAPPESAAELQRIEKGKPSYKILITRPGKDLRILCAEISEYATNPGIDIFQSGVLLGTYNYNNQQDCLSYLTQAIRAHIWERGKWRQDEYKKYTMNWFEKVLELGKGTVRVDEAFSFFHSPTLIKSDRIDALFKLITETLLKRIDGPDDQFEKAVSSIQHISDKDLRVDRSNELTERAILEILNLMKELEIIKFEEFSNPENERFKKEFSRTVRKISHKIR
jgi:hypothetical protein